MIIPGAGHIYLKLISRGIRISVTFVLLSFSLSSIVPIISGFVYVYGGSFMGLLPLLIQSIFVVPLLIIWYKQLKEVVRLSETKTIQNT